MRKSDPFYWLTFSITNCLPPANASSQTNSIFAIKKKSPLSESMYCIYLKAVKILHRQLA